MKPGGVSGSQQKCKLPERWKETTDIGHFLPGFT
jgi:hypothetical protein